MQETTAISTSFSFPQVFQFLFSPISLQQFMGWALLKVVAKDMLQWFQLKNYDKGGMLIRCPKQFTQRPWLHLWRRLPQTSQPPPWSLQSMYSTTKQFLYPVTWLEHTTSSMLLCKCIHILFFMQFLRLWSQLHRTTVVHQSLCRWMSVYHSV